MEKGCITEVFLIDLRLIFQGQVIIDQHGQIADMQGMSVKVGVPGIQDSDKRLGNIQCPVLDTADDRSIPIDHKGHKRTRSGEQYSDQRIEERFCTDPPEKDADQHKDHF